MPAWNLAWKSKAPTVASFSSSWLERHGLHHPDRCPLCDQLPENSGHLFLSCVFARQLWFVILSGWNKLEWIPTPDSVLVNWWNDLPVSGKPRKQLATSITLIIWTIWKHRNKMVFDDESVQCVWEHSDGGRGLAPSWSSLPTPCFLFFLVGRTSG
ncbi:hypothetical protein BRADI_2g18451v3 [Brachypodium distachyon]|uniref:Reverse transcriptase zinc-binding domain-containing protein n=1 Tax=Brachypodium distachyon TaxID=15368 RepID=A0A0Q3G116_BRADI|nr:hypothetical protein BRADI_2g18451v3 [Brachypodium distachyon]